MLPNGLCKFTNSCRF
ncbi:hypothetical protein LINPERPRIM_LOCUS957 [Linum perenne]